MRIESIFPNVLIAFDENCNVLFIGKEQRYLELCKEFTEFNKTSELKQNLLMNCELVYISDELLESSLEDVIYKLLYNKFKRFEIHARIQAEVFRKNKVKDFLE
jgi:hypothetical protein